MIFYIDTDFFIIDIANNWIYTRCIFPYPRDRCTIRGEFLVYKITLLDGWLLYIYRTYVVTLQGITIIHVSTGDICLKCKRSQRSMYADQDFCRIWINSKMLRPKCIVIHSTKIPASDWLKWRRFIPHSTSIWCWSCDRSRGRWCCYQSYGEVNFPIKPSLSPVRDLFRHCIDIISLRPF